MTRLRPEVRLAYRVVAASTIAAWWARGTTVVQWYQAHLSRVHVSDDYFPPWLTDAHVLPWLYLLPTFIGLVGLAFPLRAIATAHALSLVVCSFTMLIHQVSLAFQGANTSLWAGVFLLWLCARADAEEVSFRLRAAFILQLIVGMVFLGGAAGKWTAGYWNGEVLFHLMFMYQDSPKWVWLRESFDLETLREAAIYYSRAVVIGETLMATVPLWPAAWAFRGATLGVLCMWAGATPRVFDALGPVLGLCIAGWLLTRPPNAKPLPRQETFDGTPASSEAGDAHPLPRQ